MMNYEVRDIMTVDPIVVSPTQLLSEVIDLMLSNNLQQLPVVEDGQLMGMITSYDLWKASRQGQDENVRVADVMNTRIIKITPKDKVGTAAELFADRRFKTLPVVNLRNELKGVVTAFDVIKVAFKEAYPNPILYKDEFKQ